MPLLAEHFSVVAIDLRGAGYSDCPLDGYDKATMARDAHEVMIALGHDRYAVCGHDIGGMVALPQAAIYRDAITHLAVLDVPLPGWSEWEATCARLWHFGFHMNRDLPERLIYGREYDYVSAFMAERFHDHSRFDPADIEIFAKALALPGRTRGGMEWYRTFAADHAAALEYKKQPLAIPVLAPGRRPAVRLAHGPDAAGIRQQRDRGLDRTVQPLRCGRTAGRSGRRADRISSTPIESERRRGGIATRRRSPTP